MKNFVAAALLSAAIIGGPAYAQTAQPADRAAPAATTTQAAGTKMMLKGNWRASKLMGLDVYNEANEKLGDVNELILDKDGKINAVVIGVGGFLGMGEHDIAVYHGQAQIRGNPGPHQFDRARRYDARNHDLDGARGYGDHHRRGQHDHDTTTTTARSANANDWTPDHAVMSGNKEQLKAMPQFKYSDYN